MLDVKVVDPTGAGDAYCGGFVAGLVKAVSPLAAACWGTISAAHIVQGFGAFQPSPPDRHWMEESLRMLLEGRYDGEGDHLLSETAHANPPPQGEREITRWEG